MRRKNSVEILTSLNSYGLIAVLGNVGVDVDAERSRQIAKQLASMSMWTSTIENPFALHSILGVENGEINYLFIFAHGWWWRNSPAKRFACDGKMVQEFAADDDSGKSFTRNWSVSKHQGANDVHF